MLKYPKSANKVPAIFKVNQALVDFAWKFKKFLDSQSCNYSKVYHEEWIWHIQYLGLQRDSNFDYW